MLTKPVDVVVVGAGLAGLWAAKLLTDQGFSVVVLEAQDRSGGRIQTVEIENQNFDLGAAWIGAGQPRMQKLVKDLGLTAFPSPNAGRTTYLLSGKLKRHDDNSVLLPVSPIGLLDLAQMRWRIENLVSQIRVDQPWNSGMKLKELDKMTVATAFKKFLYSGSARAYWRAMLDSILCCNNAEVSTLSLLWELASLAENGGSAFDQLAKAEEFLLEGGLGQLPKRLAEQLSDKIIFNAPVTEINYCKLEDRLDHNANNYIVEVTTKSQQTWQASRVILAIPPALASRITYYPSLPAQRDQLTQRIGQGSVIKCLVVYPQPFWQKQGLNGAVYSDSGLVRSVLDSSNARKNAGILTCFITGTEARKAGTWTQEQRREAVINHLVKFFGKQAQDYQFYTDKDWSTDPWARGGFATHLPPGALTEFGPALWEPVGPIHWAGTETARRWRNYAEGALESAERAAQEISEVQLVKSTVL